MKKISDKKKEQIANRIKLLLFSGIDYCKNTNKGREYWFSPHNPYYCEAFGLLHTLNVLNYGYFGPDNIPQEHLGFNLKYWFNQIKDECNSIAESMGEHEAYAWFKQKLNNEGKKKI